VVLLHDPEVVEHALVVAVLELRELEVRRVVRHDTALTVVGGLLARGSDTVAVLAGAGAREH
jgi:hypothetical protein